MTVFERFLSFTKGLPADRLEAVEEGLAALMDSYSERYGFTADELTEIDRRAVQSDPRFADPADIERLFGKRFGE